MMPSTPTAEVRAALAKATPGAWEASTSEATMNDRNEWTFRRMGPRIVPMHFRAVMQSADASLIAAAPAWLAELCDRLEDAETKLAAVRGLAESWRYKGEFGWGPWQEGNGPDFEGQVLDYAACAILRALDGEQP